MVTNCGMFNMDRIPILLAGYRTSFESR
jgi:hypothetical protein